MLPTARPPAVAQAGLQQLQVLAVPQLLPLAARFATARASHSYSNYGRYAIALVKIKSNYTKSNYLH